ncbi:MAG: UDP-N-acetylmuramate dehydrogenase [Jatrophihabitans sp.]
MPADQPTTLAELTTLRLGGPIADLVEATDQQTLVDTLSRADGQRRPVLVVAGGSNLVAADAGWPGLVVVVRTRGIHVQPDGDDVLVTVAAGEPWDDLVKRAIAEGWAGLETMSGIPGSTGATPVQNVGAYGREIAETITALTVYDRQTTRTETWTPQRCGFGFRTSAFKHTDQFVVLDVTLRLPRSAHSLPIRYLELAGRLGVEQGGIAPTERVRETVLGLRRGKGMLLDPADHDSWSVGSFFVNPLVDVLPDAAKECPHWPNGGGIKLSAAWLIEQAGFHRGYGHGNVSVSTKHSLALTNRGGATTAELLELAAEIRAGVVARFGVRLRPEAHLAGVDF